MFEIVEYHDLRPKENESYACLEICRVGEGLDYVWEKHRIMAVSKTGWDLPMEWVR